MVSKLKLKHIDFDVNTVDIRESTEEILELVIKQAELRDIKISANYKGFPQLICDNDNQI